MTSIMVWPMDFKHYIRVYIVVKPSGGTQEQRPKLEQRHTAVRNYSKRRFRTAVSMA